MSAANEEESMLDKTGELMRLAVENTEIRDATPCWAKLQWAEVTIERQQREIDRRDVVLDWLGKNNPAALELCPFKVVRNG